MISEAPKLQREVLYEQVWSEPMVRLAKGYGITDVALAKVCRKMDIPVPPRGYWRRKEMGWRVEHPPLPKLRPGVRTAVQLTVRPRLRDRAAPSSEVEAQEAFEREPKNRIRVPRQLVNPHRLVSHTAEVLRKKKPASDGVVGTWREKCLDLCVTTKALERALRIMDALLKALEARGFHISISASDKPETHVTVLGEPLQIRLEEKIKRTPHVPTKDEARYPSSAQRWDYAPSGDLTLRIHEYWPRGTRKSWSDGRRRKLHQMLNDIVRGLVIVADA